MKKILFIIPLFFILTSFAPKQLSWVAIGDSITYMNEHTGDTDHRITKGYMTMVKEKLPYITYKNQGYNGWTAVRIAEQIEALNLTKADVYSVFLGTNDWWSGKTLGTLSDYKNNTGNTTFYGAYRTIINKLRSLNPDARIILMTPMQRVDFVQIQNMKNNAFGSYKPKNGQSLSEFADAIKEISKYEGFKTVDLFHKKSLSLSQLVNFKRLKDPKSGSYVNYKYPDFIDIPFNPEKDEYPYPKEAMNITYDGLHPSDKGYEVITKMLVKVLR